MSFCEMLKSERKANNLSQEQLAEKLGVSRQSISKWEAGDGYPEVQRIIKLCNILGTTMDLLFDDELKEAEAIKKEAEITEDNASIRKQYSSIYDCKHIVQKSHINPIDNYYGGLKKGVYNILGVTCIGRKALALNIACTYILENKKVVIILTEESRITLIYRMAGILGNINTIKLSKDSDFEKLTRAANYIENANIDFIYCYDDSMGSIRKKCESIKEDVDLFIIDNVSNIICNENSKRSKEETIRGIAGISNIFKCPVLAIDGIGENVANSMYNRKSPELVFNEVLKAKSHIRYDNILILHRDDYYSADKNIVSNVRIYMKRASEDKYVCDSYLYRKETQKIES